MSEFDRDAMPPAESASCDSSAADEPRSSSADGCSRCERSRTRAQRAVGAGPRIAQQISATARPLEPSRAATASSILTALSDLTDLVVQLARDAALLLFLCVEQSGRQSLQIDRNLFFTSRAVGQPAFEGGAVAESEPSDRHADRQRHPEHGPDLLLQAWICMAATARCCSMKAARLSACTSSEIRMAASRLGMNRRISIAALVGHSAAVGREHFVSRRAELAYLLAQTCDSFALGGTPRTARSGRAVRRSSGRHARFLGDESRTGRRFRIEQCIAHEHRCDQHLRSHRGQQFLGLQISSARRRRLALGTAACAA